jgi:hypothetical protein
MNPPIQIRAKSEIKLKYPGGGTATWTFKKGQSYSVIMRDLIADFRGVCGDEALNEILSDIGSKGEFKSE